MSMVYYNAFSYNLKSNDYFQFMTSRFARVYPVYFVALILALIYRYSVNGEVLNPRKLITNLFMWQSVFDGNIVGAAWSVSVELIAYLSFPFVLVFLQRYNVLILPVIVFCFMILHYLPLLNDTFSHGPLDIYIGKLAIFRGLSGLFIGVCSNIVLNNFSKFHVTIRFATITSIASFFVVLTLFFKGFDLIFVISSMFLVVGLACGESCISRFLSCPPLYCLGCISYSVYILHPFVHLYFTKFVNLNGFFGSEFHTSLFLLVVTLMISTVTYYLFERPTRNLLRHMLSIKNQQ